MSHKQHVEVCNFPTPNPEIDRLITNWLPICISWVTRYVTDEYTINNDTGAKTLVGKLYKQWANGTVTNTAPAWIGLATDWYCAIGGWFEYIVWCEIQQLTLTPAGSITNTATTLSFNNPLNSAYTTAWYVDKVIIDWWDGNSEVVSSWFMNGVPITHTIPTSLATGEYTAYIYVSTIDNQIFQIFKYKYSYNQTTNVVSGISGQWQGSTMYRTVRNLIQVRNEATWAITYQTDTGATTVIWAGNQFVVDCNKPTTWVFALEDIELSNGWSIYELSASPLNTHVIQTGSNINIPAWFRSVTIVKTSSAWIVNIQWIPRLYTLWASETFEANEYDYNAQRWVLPAITVANTGWSTFNRIWLL